MSSSKWIHTIPSAFSMSECFSPLYGAFLIYLCALTHTTLLENVNFMYFNFTISFSLISSPHNLSTRRIVNHSVFTITKIRNAAFLNFPVVYVPLLCERPERHSFYLLLSSPLTTNLISVLTLTGKV